MRITLNTDSYREIDNVLVWEMKSHSDLRGKLFKAFSEDELFQQAIKFHTYEHFFTKSKLNVFRGMHLQSDPHAVSKIISVVQGKALDYLIDIRPESKTFGNIQKVDLDSRRPVSIYIPTGVAHGYLACEDNTIISYRTDGAFCGSCDTGFNSEILTELQTLKLSEIIRSERDCKLPSLHEFEFRSDC